MSLGKKITLLMLVLGACFSAGSYFALRLTIYPAFEALERDAAARDRSRISQLLSSDLRALEVLNMEYSLWDQTYEYALGNRPSYPDENLDPIYWHSVETHMMMLFGTDGELLYGLIADPETGERLDLDKEFVDPLTPEHPLVTIGSIEDNRKALLRTKSGLLQVVSYPILKTSAEGPAAGTLISGQFLSDSRISELGRRAAASVELHALDFDDTRRQALPDANRPFDIHDDTVDIVYTDDTIFSRQVLTDVSGRPIAVLEIGTPRDIANTGTKTIYAATLFLLVSGIIFLLSALVFLQQQIVGPLKRLTRRILQIQRTGNLNTPLDIESSDEVGALGKEFKALTARLAQAQSELESTRDEAIALAAAKGEFLARMSHEIRTPMNGILGMTELLRNTSLETTQRRYTDTIYSSAGSLLEIINDILDFSRIEAGRLEMERVLFDLREVAEETATSLADQAQQKGLELNVVVPPHMHALVLGDPLRLRQILTNLVGNAIKFTEKGEVILRLAANERNDDKLGVRIEVEDTGIGIPEDKQSEIFESFTQADGTTTRVYGGTGLGLAISSQLVEMMDGNLEVRSTPGGGSTFYFSVVFETVPRDQYSRRTKEPVAVAGKRVLIVDDNATNREILKTQLDSWRAIAECADDASAAQRALRDAHARSELPDLVLLDVQMPKVDGLQLAEWIRNRAQYDSVRIVVLSSLADPVPEEKTSALRICGQLSKPVCQSQLYDSLLTALSGESTGVDSRVSQSGISSSLAGKVLLAEDNPVNQAVAIGLLEQLGLDVDTACNGEEAIELAKQNDYDAVLMDCQMPVLDGFTATARLREFEERTGAARLPVIAVTANALESDRQACLDAGMDDYLSKPFTGEQLHAVLSLHIESSTMPSPEASGLFDKDDAAANDASPLDREVLKGLESIGGDASNNILRQVISIYLDNSAELMERVRKAFAACDEDSVRSSAHALKSSSGNVGATRLADLCRQIELLAKKENLVAASRIQAELEAEYGHVRHALECEFEAAVA